MIILRIAFTGLWAFASFCLAMAVTGRIMIALRTANDTVVLLAFPALLIPVLVPILAGIVAWRWSGWRWTA